MDISFELYKVFYYVAKTLSFSEASGKLFISQSAVSQSIRSLEEKLNCSLFNRSTKQVKLTQEGDILFKHIEQAFHFIKSGERSVQEIHGLIHGEIRIGASDTICKYYLLPYFKKFNQLYPQIKISITNRTSPICIDLLKKGVVDVSVVNIPSVENHKHMNIQKLKALQDVFVAGNAYRHLQDKTIKLKALEQYPMLMLESNSITRDFFDAFVKENSVNIVPEIELSSVDLMIELTKIGLGISFISRNYIQSEMANDEIFILDIEEPIPERHLGVMTNNNIPVPIAAQKFIELLE
jgi:DNA-binding transcriptional LysR family regulator